MTARTPKALTRARVAPTTVAERVEQIADMMRRDEWRRGESAGPLAAAWGVAENTVRQLASEASRVVAREVTDPQRLKEDVSVVLVQNLYRASEAREFKAVATLGDVVTRINGARAPEKYEHAHSQAQAEWEQLPARDRPAWLRAQAARFLAAAEAEEEALKDAAALPAAALPTE